MALTRKWFYISIFTTNHFQVRRTKRETEREKEEIIELTPLTPILSLTSPPITELTHSRWAQPLDPLPHGSLIAVSFLSLVDFFLSSTAFVYGFDGFTPPIHTPHLTSPPIYTAPTSPHLQPHLTLPPIYTTPTSPHLNDLLDRQSLSHRSLSRRSAWSLWSLILLLLLWWCGWWHFGGFCVVWWWVLWSGGFSVGVGVWVVVIFWNKICLEAEKMVEKVWKICRKIAFLEYYQTLKIVL